MSKLLIFMQAKGKCHKLPFFNLGGGAKLYKNFAQKLLAVSLCAAMVLLAVPLGGQGVHVVEAAAEPTRTETPITVPADNLDATGNDKAKWKKNGDVYETQNQGSNSTACTMDVPVEVTAGYAELEFEWKVSSKAGFDFLRFELKDAADNVLQSNQKSGEETAFDKVVFKLDNGTYTLTFTYQGDGGSVSGTRLDTGYVKNLNLVTYSGVSAISKTMFAEPKDLIDPNNFSLATAEYSTVGKISFGTRPGEVKYYKHDWSTVHSVGTAGTPTPITWLIAGSDADNGLVLYSAEPLVSANAAVYEYDEDLGTYPPTSGGADSRFQVDYDIKTYTAPAGSGYATAGDISVYANHWGESNLRAQLRALASNSNYFKSAEQGLMATSTVSTIDMKNNDANGSAVTYTTNDILYAPRLIATDFSFPTDTSVTVGGAPSLAIDMAHWGGRSWLRSPNPSYSLAALVALPGRCVSGFVVGDVNPSISAAFRLNLSSVLFTSAASAASSAEGGKFEAISADTPMTLRVNKYCGGTATLSEDKKSITVEDAAAGDVLMVQGVTDDGQNWSYSKPMTGEVTDTLTASTVAQAANFSLSDFSNCNIWLERTTGEAGSTVTYASTPIVAGATESTSHAGCTIELVSKLDATCTEPGHEAHYKCSVCGQLFSDATGTTPIDKPEGLPATGHNSSGAWQKDETHHWNVCGTCSDKIENAEHTWDGGTVTTQPTASAPGVKTYTCSVCGHTRTETIPMLDWGSPMTRSDGKTQYVVDDPSSPDHGKTSIEIKEDNLSQGDILWLLEESDGTSAWYGVDLSSGAFDLDNGLRFYVQWLSPHDAGYAEVYAQLDAAQKARVEDDNGWMFLIGVEDPAGNKVQPSKPVSVYVQIGDDWDVDDLNAYYITSGGDENVPVDHLMVDYPNGTDTFGRMTLEHFSPYIIFDELTDAERAALGIPSTGDISTELLISVLAIVILSSLGVMLRLITNKKKFEE